MTNEMFEALYGDLPTDDPRAALAPGADSAVGGEPEPTEEFIRDALRLVVDPEVGLDIVTLGLVYQVSVEQGVVTVVHTLTTPGCPMEHVIGDGIETVLGATRGVRGVKRHLVFQPEWHPGMIAEEGWS